jgi:hypothetical protein
VKRDRYLLSTQPIFCKIISDIAGRELCNPHALCDMSDGELEQHIAAVIAWANKQRGPRTSRTPEDSRQ